MTPLSLLLIREMPGATLQEIPTALPYDASQQIPAKSHLHKLYRLSVMDTKMDKMLKTAGTRYQRYFDESVCNLVTSRPRDYLFFGRLPTQKTAAEQIADERRLRLLPKAIGPYRITAVTSHTKTINEGGLSDVI